MQNDQNNAHLQQEEGEIDIIGMIKTLWEQRRPLIKIVGAFVLLGLFVALFSEKKYSSRTILVPQIESKKMEGSLGGLASMAGIDINSMLNKEVLPPIVYPQIISSTSFQKELMECPLFFEKYNKEISLYEYYTEYHRPSIVSVVLGYTLGLPGKIISLFRAPADGADSSLPIPEDVVILNDKEQAVARTVREVVSLNVDSKDGSITIASTFPDRVAVAHLVHETQLLLRKYITKYKLERITSNLHFIQGRYDEAKVEHNRTQEKFATFLDSNIGLTTASARVKLKKLEDELNLQYAIYSELALQLERTKIAEKETTPILTVIEPVTVPVEKSHPQRAKIIFVYTFLGCIIGAGVILFTPMAGRALGNKKMAAMFSSKKEEDDVEHKEKEETKEQ